MKKLSSSEKEICLKPEFEIVSYDPRFSVLIDKILMLERRLYCHVLGIAMKHKDHIYHNSRITKPRKKIQEIFERCKPLEDKKRELKNEFIKGFLDEETFEVATAELNAELNEIKKPLKELYKKVREFFRTEPSAMCYFHTMEVYHEYECENNNIRHIMDDDIECIEGAVPGEFYYKSKSQKKGVFLYVPGSYRVKSSSGKSYVRLVEAHKQTIEVLESDHLTFKDSVYNGHAVIIPNTFDPEKCKCNTFIAKSAYRLDKMSEHSAQSLMYFYLNNHVFSLKKGLKRKGKSVTQKTSLTYKDYGLITHCFDKIGIMLASTLSEFPADRNHRFPKEDEFSTIFFPKGHKYGYITVDPSHPRYAEFYMHNNTESVRTGKILISPNNKYPTPQGYLSSFDYRALSLATTQELGGNPLVMEIIRKKVSKGRYKYYLGVCIPLNLYPQKNYGANSLNQELGRGKVGIDTSYQAVFPIYSETYGPVYICPELIDFNLHMEIMQREDEIEEIDAMMAQEKKDANPDHYNEKGEYIYRKKDAPKVKTVLTPRWYELKKKRSELYYVQSKRKAWMRKLIVHEIAKYGDDFRIEFMDYSKAMKKRKGRHEDKNGKVLSNRQHSRSIHFYGTASIWNELITFVQKRGGKIRWISTYATKCTSYDPSIGDTVKKDKTDDMAKQLSRYIVRGGVTVHRDFYSSFLLCYLEDVTLIEHPSERTKKLLYGGRHNDTLLLELLHKEFVPLTEYCLSRIQETIKTNISDSHGTDKITILKRCRKTISHIGLDYESMKEEFSNEES